MSRIVGLEDSACLYYGFHLPAYPGLLSNSQGFVPRIVLDAFRRRLPVGGVDSVSYSHSQCLDSRTVFTQHLVVEDIVKLYDGLLLF